MRPLTKLWLFKLRDGKSISDPPFMTLLSSILDLIASYTKPEPGAPSLHAFYEVTNRPAHLLMITGYPSQELNTAVDRVYSERFLGSLFEFVQHIWLRQIEVDLATAPLEAEGMVVTCGARPEDGIVESGTGKGIGGWDVWKKTQQGKQGGSVVQGVREHEDDAERTWVQIKPWNSNDEEDISGADEVFYLREIISR
ncbi:hypothetical protein BDW74DRAFT_181419 [Aspergillus multicolor]|uniref:uncharacterized protein n=1 Tax=Aspergillus multicolor TaxID=41759 RepID=UPI003CCD1E74